MQKIASTQHRLADDDVAHETWFWCVTFGIEESIVRLKTDYEIYMAGVVEPQARQGVLVCLVRTLQICMTRDD